MLKALIDSDQLAEEVQNLPPMVPSLLRLTELVGSGDYNLSEVEELIHYDQGLTIDTLRLANSVPMAAHNQIGSVHEAVIRLGGERITRYLYSRWLGGAVKVPLRSYGMDASRFWSHGVIVALVCESMAKTSKSGIDSGTMFTAGLLHDFGKVVLDHFAARMRIELDWQQIPDGSELYQLEQDVFGATHADIGAALMTNWHFSESVIAASKALHGDSCGSDVLRMAHRIDAWIVEQETGVPLPLGAACLESSDPIPEGIAQKVWSEYEKIRASVVG